MDSRSPLNRRQPSNSSPASSSSGSAQAYNARGEQRAPGAPLVLLHELTLDRRAWDSVLDALPSSGRVIAFDLPGHGSCAALSRPGLYAVADAIHAGLNIHTPSIPRTHHGRLAAVFGYAA